MLSPHEFSTLMLVHCSPGQIELERMEFGALLERNLVIFEQSTGGNRRVQLTETGRLVLALLAQRRDLSVALE